MAGSGSDGPRSRPRRFDPDRRGRIVSAALESIVEFGVKDTTHRTVAAKADVPLGSVTYHFASINDVVAAAFGLFVQEQNTLYRARFEGVRTRDELVEIMARIVAGGPERHRSGVLGFELHLAALRNAELRHLTEEWSAESRQVLGRFLDPVDAARVDALLEGMILHALLATVPPAYEDALAQISGAVPDSIRAFL
jgi:DNA-binding transcriptional regulator YbjK